MVFGEEEAAARVARVIEDVSGEVEAVALDEAGADGGALSGEEGIGHGAADADGVASGDEGVDDVDLVGDLGAAEDGDER